MSTHRVFPPLRMSAWCNSSFRHHACCLYSNPPRERRQSTAVPLSRTLPPPRTLPRVSENTIRRFAVMHAVSFPAPANADKARSFRYRAYCSPKPSPRTSANTIASPSCMPPPYPNPFEVQPLACVSELFRAEMHGFGTSPSWKMAFSGRNERFWDGCPKLT